MSSVKNRIIIEQYINGGFGVFINGVEFMGNTERDFKDFLKIMEAIDWR
jgi:hypothetical protein